MGLALLILAGCDHLFVEGGNTESGQAYQALLAEANPTDSGELVFRRVKTHSYDGLPSVKIEGELSMDTWQRAARPHLYANSDEDWLYSEHGWADSDDGGNIVDIYEVRRRANEHPADRQLAPTDAAEVEFSPLVTELAGEADDRILLLARLKNYPRMPMPMTPPPHYVSIVEASELADEMQAVRQIRESEFAERSSGFRDFLSEHEGRFYGGLDSVGWVTFEFPVDHLHLLKERTDIDFVQPSEDPTSSDDGDSLGRMRIPEMLGVQYYWDDGHDGEVGNPSHHDYPRMAGGVVESNFFEERRPCFLHDQAGCPEAPDRVMGQHYCEPGQYLCSISNCWWMPAHCNEVDQWTDFFSTEYIGDAGRGHGTLVAGNMLADYTAGQGDGQPLGDPDYDVQTGTHSEEWEKNATAMARGAGLVYFRSRTEVDSRAQAYEDISELGVDVLNMSHGYMTSDACDTAIADQRLDVLTEAYDQGIFLITSAGNQGTIGTCSARQPASMPRVFAVNGLHMYEQSCQDDYRFCEIDVIGDPDRDPGDQTPAFVYGGANASFDGSWVVNAKSVIDLAAPALLRQTTRSRSWTDFGHVTDGNAQGTSHVSPLVAGSALTLKDYLITTGQMWVNNPGRLHALMLAMSDRWSAQDWHEPTDPWWPTWQRNLSGADFLSGFGRLKMRPMKVGQEEIMRRWSISTTTHTVEGWNNYEPWSTPVQENVSHLKCTMVVPQDHRNTTDMADIYLEVGVGDPVNGQCDSSVQTDFVRADDSLDSKHMVAVIDNVADRCVRVRRNVRHLPPGESQLTSTFCYAGTKDDIEPY